MPYDSEKDVFLAPTSGDGIPTPPSPEGDTDSGEGVPLSPLRSKWIRRMKLQLGGSRILSLEVNDAELNELIDMAYDKMIPFATDSRYLTRNYSNHISLKNEHVEEVLRVIPGTELAVSGVAYDEMLFDFQAYKKGCLISPDFLIRKAATPDVNIPFTFDPEQQMLYVSEGYTIGPITIEVSVKPPLEDIKDDRALQWIFNYALALAKEVIGRIRSKMKSSNVPMELDGDAMLSEAQSERQALESSLATEAYGPMIILR